MMMLYCTPKPCWLLLLLLVTACRLDRSWGYYVGESVDTTIYVSSGDHRKIEANKAQNPKFGMDTSVYLPRTVHSNERFSLGFEEGYHQLSWVDPVNLGKLRVIFMYTKSGDGVIHSVSSEPMMKYLHEDYHRNQLEIEYVWVEEHPVDPQAGSIVMFLGTLILSIALALQTCGSSDDDDDDGGDLGDDPDDDDYIFGVSGGGSRSSRSVRGKGAHGRHKE